MKYEYKRIKIGNVTDEVATDKLNEYAADGWELISVVGIGYENMCQIIYLRREKSN